MRGRFAFLLAVLGVAAAAVARALRRGRTTGAPESAPAVADPRAEELRRRLEESRAIVGERDVFEEAEVPIDQAEPLADPETRRRAVHDAGRAAAERMRTEE